MDLADTIVALSSASGPARRGIVRLSGPKALTTAAEVFETPEFLDRCKRRFYAGAVRLAELTSVIPADLYVWPAPATYTGQDLAELHTLSSPPLLELLIAHLLNAGCRAARPGEFTLRAFLAGKIDLPRAEAVLGVIEANDQMQLRQALTQLAGGVTRPLDGLRTDLLDLLADVEAGLDFSDEELDFADSKELLDRIARGLAQVTLVQKHLHERSLARESFRVVLAGAPNAGKSSLFNALAGADLALVSPTPGTTRDYLVRGIRSGDTTIELVDTAGQRPIVNAIEEQAQRLGNEQARSADLTLWCFEAGREADEQFLALKENHPSSNIDGVVTKCDLASSTLPYLATSSLTGTGIEELRSLLFERARSYSKPALEASLSRCRHHVDACLTHLRQAHAAVLYNDPAEILAMEVRAALDQLGEMVGAVFTDDLLDRIFSRFCIGK
jgi:tRNA modification GTPase